MAGSNHENRRSPRPGLPAATFLFVLVAAAAASGQSALDGAVTGAGGGVVSNSTHRLGATLGQGAAGAAPGAEHAAGIGFWYLTGGDVSTAVADDDAVPALRTDLGRNAPNPFNPQTSIRYTVGTAGPVALTLFDLQGREIAKLVDRRQEAGSYTLDFRPRGLASGTYIYRLLTADAVLTRRMVLLK